MGNVNVVVGPQHPALKEPASFSITLNGEKIVEMDVRLGYNHRGIEKACEARTYIQDVYLIERICGICSHSHSTAFVTAVEEVAKLQVPARGLYIRTIVAELERIHSHLLWLGVAGHEIGFDTLLMYSWRDREAVMDLLALLTGNRVNYGINTIGGVRRDITKEQIAEIKKTIDLLEERTKYYVQVATEEITIIKRRTRMQFDWEPLAPQAELQVSIWMSAVTIRISHTRTCPSKSSPTIITTSSDALSFVSLS
jgi:membrane-bound hydrogenase subunit alpha